MDKSNSDYTHFEGKTAMEHVAKTQALGIIDAAEKHGFESPGTLNAGLDAARDTAVLLSMIGIVFFAALAANAHILGVLSLFALAWLIWKSGRSAWLGWTRLERLHRILAQERWEIEHHRQQEREELRVLYSTKGFEGQLLEDVLDVLMADNERLLKIMVEEEMGMRLESQEHPLKLAAGAALGVLASSVLILAAFAALKETGLYAGSMLALGIAAGWTAKREGNHIVAAIVWSIGIALAASGSLYFLLDYFHIRAS